MIGHLDRALDSNDRAEIRREINEGKKLQRNKHILLAKNYGWDTVKCYTAEPLASDSKDEKKVKKAVKKSKALKKEKRASSSRPKMRKPTISQRQGSTWGSQTSRPTGPESLVLRSPEDEIVRCFRCRKPGHIDTSPESADQ